jgi:hypothetical protein
LWQQKSRKQIEADFFRVQKWTNRPKCDIVDTNPHASRAPGIIGTNNTAFLLYGSGLDKQKGGTHKKLNGHDFNGFRTYCATEFCANGCMSSPCGTEKLMVAKHRVSGPLSLGFSLIFG